MPNYDKFEDDFRNILVRKAHSQILENGGERGLKYLLNRGIDIETIKKWNIGYCPNHINDFILNDKILIPFYDHYGELFSTSFRKVDGEKPYWWNESFEKGNFLFGLDKAKYKISLYNFVIIVEGQFDVISLHNHGLDMAVGICGSYLSERRINLLSRLCNRFVLAFDSDENLSGQKASRKAFEDLKYRNLYIHNWVLPKGMDPDDYIRKNGRKKCSNEIKQCLCKKYKNRFGQEYLFN